MTARVQIQIEAQDAASGVLRAIVSQFGALGTALSDASDLISKTVDLSKLYNRGLTDMSVSTEDVARAQEMAQAAGARFAETLTLLAIDLMRDAINNVIEYAGEVENLARMSGMTAEQSSRMLQVFDDFKITADDVTTATRKMTQNGFAPSLDTIAQLSDQYLLLNNAQERNNFLIENFGRGGAQWAKVLEQGSDAILMLNDAVSENLILNQKQIEAADALRLQQDALSDSGKGLSITFGAYMTPALSGLIGILDGATNGLADFFEEMANNRTISIETSRILKEQGYFTGLINTATAEQVAVARELAIANIEAANGTQELVTAEEDAAAAMELMTEKNREFLSMVGSAQNILESYENKNQSLAEERIRLEEQKAKLILQGYSEQGAKVQEVTAKLEENKKKTAEVSAQFELENRKIILGYLERKLTADGTLTDDELNWLLEKGQAWGIYSEEAIAAMQAAMDEANNLIDTYNSIPTYINTNINTSYTTTGNPPTTIGPPGVYASGGEVYAGNPVTVGEAGKETFMPSQNGRILGHAESLHAMSLGGGSNYFYGNVTLQISEDAAGGLLEYR